MDHTKTGLQKCDELIGQSMDNLWLINILFLFSLRVYYQIKFFSELLGASLPFSFFPVI